ncbi:MAG: hypothetical protein HY043_21365 [Verrucomicrobia bacterium]|nr:hypothetical protein [Verrucomicrobiota bacterium]
MKTLTTLSFVAVLILSGCGKKDAASNASATNAAAPSSGNPLTAPVDYLGAVSKAQKTAVKVLDVSSINKAIQEFNAGEGRYPNDLNELVKEHYLGSVPTAPAGTKFEYNPATGQMRVVRLQ